METRDRRLLRRATVVAGIVISAAFLWLVTRSVEWSRMLEELKHVRLMPLVLGLIGALATMVAMAYRWRLLLGETVPVSVAETFDFITIGFLAGLVMPQRLGDLVKVVLMARRAGASRTTILASVLLERLSDVIMLLGLAAGFALTVRLPILLEAAIGVLTVTTASAIVMLGLWPALTTPMLSIARRYLPAAVTGTAESLVLKLAAGLHGISSAAQFGSVLGMAALVWALSGLSMSAYVAAFDLAVPWYAGVLVIVLTNLGGILPSSPGSLGVYHYMAVLALTTFIPDRTAALSFAIVTHALAMMLIVSTGVWGLARQGLSLRAVQREV